MNKAILATKVGMTQIFNENGVLTPVTVLQAGPCYVTQVKTVDNDGYSAVQVGFVDKKDKVITKDASGKKEIKRSHGVNKPLQGHFAKAEFCGCLLPFVNAVSTTPILYFLAFSHILAILISLSAMLFSYDIGKSYPVIKHSGNNRISAWFSEASSIAIMIVSIFLSICSLIERFCSIATLNIHFPSYR